MSWAAATEGLLVEAFGPDHELVLSFGQLRFGRDSRVSEATARRGLARSLQSAVGVVEAALTLLGSEVDGWHSGGLVLPDLQRHIEAYVGDGRGVALASCLFLEDTVRRILRFPDDLVGTDLMARAFDADRGGLRLGRTKGEAHGWKLLAMGLIGACRNPAAHRITDHIHDRPNGMRVAATVSLILNEIRITHPELSNEVSDESAH